MSSGEERAVEPAESRDVSPASHGSFDRASPMLRPDSALKSSASSAELRTRGHSDNDDTDSEVSESENFLSKGAFLLTPAGELNMEKASAICEKMNFKGPYSLTKTATGILFKFAEPEDYQATFKKGFHKVTGARFYRKIPIPCRPQKTFVVFILEVPEEIPEEDIRHSLYKYQSIVEVTRLQNIGGLSASPSSSSIPSIQQSSGNPSRGQDKGGKDGSDKSQETAPSGTPPPIIRVTLASLDECNILIQNGLDFYGATFFPAEPAINTSLVRAGRKSATGNSRLSDIMAASGQRVRDLLPVFDAAGFAKIPPPASRIVKPKST
ncbi:uncharacterized protein LOC142324073 [Lycorma delicatula]|uniref:uncharacterized protein LOC142324073 n=1 Tax=Lycorma delicatula TaxID=130591 RepID=UPI003F5174AA